MILAVTIDTEADRQWDYGVPLTTRNAAHWAPFQSLCERHDAAPTYLVTTEIAADDRARDLLKSWVSCGRAEVGAHLHPWSTAPFADMPGLRHNDPIHAFPSQLPDELLAAKLETLTKQIAIAFGHRPTSYRAGRFGFDTRSATLLARAGYLADSSVTPLWAWTDHLGLDGHGGPDFRRHPLMPFRVAGSGDPGLLELPVTLCATYGLLQRFPPLLEVYRWLPVRAFRKLLLSRWLLPQPMWLSPDPRYGAGDLAAVWRTAEKAGLEIAVMMLHSSELMPGASPFRPDAQSVRDLLDCLDAFFCFVREQDGTFVTLTQAARMLAIRSIPERVL